RSAIGASLKTTQPSTGRPNQIHWVRTRFSTEMFSGQRPAVKTINQFDNSLRGRRDEPDDNFIVHNVEYPHFIPDVKRLLGRERFQSAIRTERRVLIRGRPPTIDRIFARKLLQPVR